MNLIEAVKSGRPFKRPCHVNWHRAEGNYIYWADGSEKRAAYMETTHILADDWETQETAVTITRNQFWTAVHGSSSSQLGQELRLDYAGIESLARKLGLEPA